MINFVIIGIILVILGGAAVYVFKAKKSGAKCVGCPSSKTCGLNCHCAYTNE